MNTEMAAEQSLSDQISFAVAPRRSRLTICQRKLFLFWGDLVALIVSAMAALVVWQAYSGESRLSWEVLCLCVLWLVFALVTDAYGMATIRNRKVAVFQPLYNTVLVGVTATIFYFFTPTHYPRATMLFFCAIACTTVFAWRLAYFAIFARLPMQQRVLLVGRPECAHEMQSLLVRYPHWYEITGVVDNMDELRLVAGEDVDEIIYADCELPSHYQLEQLLHCRERGINITLMPLFYEQLLERTPIRYLHGWYSAFLPFADHSTNIAYPLAKRALDFVLTLVGLAVFLPLLPLLALAIRLDSPGPIFYSQWRVGHNGRRFKLWKLRTMFENADKQGPTWTENGDRRVTRVGKILRKVRLDEFPQLWNVLKGDLSIVGVRPLDAGQCRQFAREIPYHDLRHLVKPGVTGWAVVQFRHVNDLEGAKMRLEYDLYYIRHQSMWLDLFIICRTAWIILTGRGM